MSLTLDYPLKPKSLDGVARDFGEIACFALQLLARICSKSERQELASQSHKHALKLNPFLWQSFTDLCHLRQNDEPPIDPDQVFQFTNETFQTCQSQSSYLGVREVTLDSMVLLVPPTQQQQPLSSLNHPQSNLSAMYSPSTLTTPVDQIIQQNNPPNLNLRAIPFDATTPSHNNNHSNPNNNNSSCNFITPQEQQSQPVLLTSNHQNKGKVPLPGPQPPATAKKQFRLMSNFSPMTPSFGVMPLTSPLLVNNSYSNLHTPQQPGGTDHSQDQPVVVAKKIRSHHNTTAAQHNNSGSIKRKDSPLPESKFLLNQVNNMTNVRRSSRLFSSNNYSVKENNNKQAEQANNLLNKAPKSPMRKSKQRITSKLNSTAATLKGNLNLNSSLNELNEKANNNQTAKATLIEDVEGELQQQQNVHLMNPRTTTATSNNNGQLDAQQMHQHVLNLKRESVDGLMALLRQLGKACSALDRFNCREALDLFRALPPQHLTSAWVQSQIALAHHEVHEYEAAARIFKDVHRQEPHRLQLMEIYSTALWHLQREVELSALAHDLMAQDKASPVTWCVTGNCFSLHKEHDVAIKFFQRAVQVDPEFVYSYILLGHEFVITEELEKAMSCFRTAINKEFRHYNAWFGIGTIYSKQEKFQQAELYYARALKINPRNSVLLVHIGAMQLFSKQMEQALKTLNAAIRLDPKNPLGKFHRSRLYFATKRYEEALAELEELKEIVPKESVIYYLIGKIHTKMGNCDLGLMHFSWASDLDPKGANNQIKESFDSAAAMASGSGVNTSGGEAGQGGGSGSGAGGGGLADSTVNTTNNSSHLHEDDGEEGEEEEDEDDDEEGLGIAEEALDEDVSGQEGIAEELLLLEGEDQEVEMASRSFQTPTTGRNRTGESSSQGVPVQAPVRPGVTTPSTVAGGGITTPATTVETAAESATSVMDTPRMWNVLNYDSDSF